MSWAQTACEMREAALEYMDRSGSLQKFIEDCKRYHESSLSYAVYRFVISVNPMDMTELNAILGNYILHEPMRAAQIFQSVCDTAVRTLSLIGQYQTEAQIHVVLRLTHLPELPGYRLSLTDFPLDYTSRRFFVLEGVVKAMTTVTKYTQGARFLCSEEKCQFSKGFRYIRVHIPGATESATMRNDFVCDLCASPLKEDMKYRVLGDKQVFDLIDSKALRIFQGSGRNCHYRLQSYAVFARDELIDKMKIGGRYRVVGIPVCGLTGSQVTVCIEANNIHQFIAESPPAINGIFHNLHSATLSSPWIFTGILANVFASQVVPVGTYNTLKLCILLSLVQTCSEDRENGNFLDVLVVTSDTLIIDRLMSYSLCLVPRGVRHLSSNDIFATISKDDHGTGTARVHACSALLAKGGICFIGDINLHKKDKLDHLQSVLESRVTTVFIPGKKYGEDVDHQMFIPVQCNFWSYVDYYSKKQIQKDSLFIGQVDLSVLPSSLADAFGLLVYINDTSQSHPVLPLVQQSLSRGGGPAASDWTASRCFATQDYEKLIAYARNLNATISIRAERLINSYYLASRRVRSDMHGSKMSTSALRHLFSLSEAHAKLSLRCEVTEEDALIGILLFEVSLTVKHAKTNGIIRVWKGPFILPQISRWEKDLHCELVPTILVKMYSGTSAQCWRCGLKEGGSVFSVSPAALFPTELHEEAHLYQRDIYLKQCHHQLLQFISTYGPGTAVYISEE